MDGTSVVENRARKAPARTRAGNRREALMAAAARLIAEKGFEAASMRDIATAVEMLPGSVYYYFASKEELFVAVHAEAVERILVAVEAAVNGLDDPWDRLEAACGAHLEALIGGSLVAIVSPDFPGIKPDLLARLVSQRDVYERRFRGFVDDLPLPAGVERSMVSLMLLGSLNWTPTWYHPGRKTPAEIGRTYVRLLRASMNPAKA